MNGQIFRRWVSFSNSLDGAPYLCVNKCDGHGDCAFGDNDFDNSDETDCGNCGTTATTTPRTTTPRTTTPRTTTPRTTTPTTTPEPKPVNCHPRIKMSGFETQTYSMFNTIWTKSMTSDGSGNNVKPLLHDGQYVYFNRGGSTWNDDRYLMWKDYGYYGYWCAVDARGEWDLEDWTRVRNCCFASFE